MILNTSSDTLLGHITSGRARIGVIGLGYVGLPLAVQFAAKHPTVGFDVDSNRVQTLNDGRSHIGDIASPVIEALVREGRFGATTDFANLRDCDCIVVCVPTPLTAGKEPDISYIVAAGEMIAKNLRPGQLIVLESTTYPGTTDDVFLPMLEKTGLELDLDFHVAFSPERIDPGNRDFEIADIPKVVGGCSEQSTEIAAALYERIFKTVHRVSSSRVAEMTKLLENTFRAVNIGLANEMALLCRKMGINNREVIEAANTKPFGFMAFYPGAGVGGHCIPLDPLYLSWKAKHYGISSRFINVADEVNSAMPEHVVRLVVDGLNAFGKSLRGARVLMLGVSYKKNVADVRHSPALVVLDRLHADGAIVSYHDPFVSKLDHERTDVPERTPIVRGHQSNRRARGESKAAVNGRRRSDPLESIAITDEMLRKADCVVVTTAHDSIDYERVARLAPLVVDMCYVVPTGKKARIISL
ncbi:MAG TPA: nucleotide sugar dehydrogenase [Candidatus Baltobacteraceae bacterium]